MIWKRPKSVPVGQVWRRFKGRYLDGKPVQMYQIRDMDEKEKNRCLDMMQEAFMRDEPVNKVVGLSNDPVSVAEVRANWEQFVSQDISIACYTEVDGQPDELVGFNVLLVYSKDDEEEDLSKIQGVSYKKILTTLVTAEKLVNIHEHYGVDMYLTSSGLIVLPGHRGQNIGARMIEAREPICKAFGINASATVFTATTSQALAKKCGYELLAELNYADMKQYGIDLMRDVQSGSPGEKVQILKANTCAQTVVIRLPNFKGPLSRVSTLFSYFLLHRPQ